MRPNIELLKDAYAIIDGIPDDRFHLDYWQDATGEVAYTAQAIGCGTIACAGGWLALHPTFQQVGIRPNGLGAPVLDGEKSGVETLAKVFEISYEDGVSLFAAPNMQVNLCPYDSDFWATHGFHSHPVSDMFDLSLRAPERSRRREEQNALHKQLWLYRCKRLIAKLESETAVPTS